MAKVKKEKIVHTALEKLTWRQLALLAVEKETTISSLIRQAIRELILRETSEES